MKVGLGFKQSGNPSLTFFYASLLLIMSICLPIHPTFRNSKSQ